MALRVGNRAKITASAPGTGAFPATVAVTGFIGFNSIPGIANNDTVEYTAWDGAALWETGLAVYNSTGPVLTRSNGNVEAGSSGAGTLVNFSGNVTIWCDLSAGQLLGQMPATATNDDALAGRVGEFIETTIAGASAVSYTAGIAGEPQNVMQSATLTPGDYTAEGTMNTTGGPATNALVGFHSASNTFPANPYINVNSSVSANASLVLSRRRFKFSAPGIIYMVAGFYNPGTLGMYGNMNVFRTR